jgi:hypothetical protein
MWIPVAVALCAAACSSKPDEALRLSLATFFQDVRTIDDPLSKSAALNDPDDPGRARDYFNAHERLRNQMVDPASKAVILAAFLSKEPTSLRPLKTEKAGEDMNVTVALGPTDDVVAVMVCRKVEGAWKIVDFDGAWTKHKTERGIDTETPDADKTGESD